MATPLVIPPIGNKKMITVNRWVKSEGDKVVKGDILAELCSSENCIKYKAPVKGTLLKIIVLENTSVQSGSLLGVIGTPGEDLSTIIEPSFPDMNILLTR